MTEMPRYKWTSHGPMLDEDGPFVLLVDAKDAIAATENAFRNAEGAWYRAGEAAGYERGKRDAIVAAVQRVEAYEYISTIGVTLSSVVPKASVIAAIKGDQP